MPASTTATTTVAAAVNDDVAPQGITKQYKTKLDPYRHKERIIDEPAYVDTVKSTKQIKQAERRLQETRDAIETAERKAEIAYDELLVERSKDPDIVKCFVDWARGLRTCARPKMIGQSSESYNLVHVPKVWVDALKEADLEDKFSIDAEMLYRREKGRVLLRGSKEQGPFQLRSTICYSRDDESYQLLPEPHGSFLKMLELCGVTLWMGV